MIKLSDFIMNYLASFGVKHVFTLPGGGCMHLIDSLGKEKRITPVGYLHEQAAVIAADAYAQYTGRTGTALVTTGPGSTNAITAVTASWIDSTPLLVMSGQVKRCDLSGKNGPRQKGIQEADIVSMVKNITKYAVTVMKPEDILFHIEKALSLAESGRKGPVWLDIPLDVQGAMIDETKLEHFVPENKESDNGKIKKYASKTISLLKKSKRPVILAGNGIRLAGAEKEFEKLIRVLNIPVLTTWRAADFLDDKDKLYFGRPGSIASRYANFIQQNCDCILILGARLDLPQVGHNYNLLAREAKKIIVENDSREMKKYPMHIAVKALCDVKEFITVLSALAEDVSKREWFEYCNRMKQKYAVLEGYLPKAVGAINTYDLVNVLSENMTAQDVFVPGSSGSCAEITMQAVKVKKGQRILNTPGLGSMGFGLPASSGACIASGKRTVTVIGDGGLQHNIQTFETIKRLNLPLKIFILNNDGYGSIRLMQTRHFKGRYVCCDAPSGMSIPNIEAVAGAYGIKTVSLDNKSDLEETVKKVLSYDGPVLCNVKVEPWLETAPRISSFVKPDGSIVSKPLEDLWPFLDREEFEEAMIIEPLKE